MIHITYFDNTNVSENFAETKAYLEDACGGAVTDEKVWNELSEIERQNWEDCLDLLEELFAGRKCIAYGTIGTWMGNREGAKLFDEVKDAINSIVKDCDYITIENSDEGTIKVTASHHDGTHHMELKAVNPCGVRYYECQYHWDRQTEFEILMHLWESKYNTHRFKNKEFVRA